MHSRIFTIITKLFLFEMHIVMFLQKFDIDIMELERELIP